MKTVSKNKIIRQNQRTGLKTAYWEATGKKAKTLKEAATYFGVKV